MRSCWPPLPGRRPCGIRRFRDCLGRFPDRGIPMSRPHLPAIGAVMLAAACARTSDQRPAATTAGPRPNPFLAASTLPYQAPPFDKITDADFKPAIDEGMRQNLAEI